MTIRDRLYVAAVKLPPSPERAEILDLLVVLERQSRQPKSELERQATRYYRKLLQVVEAGELPTSYLDRVHDWLPSLLAKENMAMRATAKKAA